MTATIDEHRVALDLSPDFTESDSHKARSLLHRIRRLQHLADTDRANGFTGGERAALLWALSELGVICGKRLQRRRGADIRCVRPDGHRDECDGALGRAS